MKNNKHIISYYKFKMIMNHQQNDFYDIFSQSINTKLKREKFLKKLKQNELNQ